MEDNTAISNSLWLDDNELISVTEQEGLFDILVLLYVATEATEEELFDILTLLCMAIEATEQEGLFDILTTGT